MGWLGFVHNDLMFFFHFFLYITVEKISQPFQPPDVLHRLGPLAWLLWFGRFEEGWKGPLEVENSEFTPYNNRPLLKAPKGKVNVLKTIIFVGANC